MATRPNRFMRVLSLLGVALGLLVFGVGAAILSVVALAGVGLAALGAVAYTWFSLGRGYVLAGLASALVGALVAWIAMRWMMRWVALSSGLSLVLTLEGTSAILGTSLVMSILPAMGYVHFRARFRPSFGKSLGYGLILSLAGGIPLVILLLGEVNAVAREPAIPVAFLLGVPVLFAFVLEVVRRVLGNRVL